MQFWIGDFIKLFRFNQFLLINNGKKQKTILRSIKFPQIQQPIFVSEIFQCVLNVYREGTFHVSVAPAMTSASNVVNVVYRGSLNEWDHYDILSHFMSSNHITDAQADDWHISALFTDVPLTSSMDISHECADMAHEMGPTSPTRQTIHQDIDGPFPDIVDSSNVSSLNVIGCTREEKRQAIDDYLHQQLIHVAFLQETKMSPGDYNTRHYRWYFSSGVNKVHQSRGVAILIHVSAQNVLRKIVTVTSNMMACEIDLQGESIFFVNSSHSRRQTWNIWIPATRLLPGQVYA